MKNQKSMSEGLGFSQNYLSVYRHSRRIPSGVDIETLLRMYKDECIAQQALLDSFHEMYYTLRSQRKIKDFALWLQKQNILGNYNGIHSVILHSFSTSYGLRHRSFMRKISTILNCYEEWK